MQGVLLSLSGGQYRSNTISPETGVLSFANLVSFQTATIRNLDSIFDCLQIAS